MADDQIAITSEDVATVMQAEPMFALQTKCAALTRMLVAKCAELAALEEKYRELVTDE
jgi:hypothetical protein